MELSLSHQEHTITASLSGKFTFSDSKEFHRLLEQLKEDHYKTLVLNLDGVEFVDSAALGMLLLARDEAGKQGKQVILRQPTGQVAKIFDVANFSSLFTIQ